MAGEAVGWREGGGVGLCVYVCVWGGGGGLYKQRFTIFTGMGMSTRNSFLIFLKLKRREKIRLSEI